MHVNPCDWKAEQEWEGEGRRGEGWRRTSRKLTNSAKSVKYPMQPTSPTLHQLLLLLHTVLQVDYKLFTNEFTRFLGWYIFNQ
jgi:hypothetical protein